MATTADFRRDRRRTRGNCEAPGRDAPTITRPQVIRRQRQQRRSIRDKPLNQKICCAASKFLFLLQRVMRG